MAALCVQKYHHVLAQVQVPQQLQSDLKARMEAAGIPVPDTEERWGLALEALKVTPSFSTAVTSVNPAKV
jgi:hypothetical protein